MTPLYQEHPTMFADEPGRFILACLLVPLGIGIVWLIWWFITNRSEMLTVDEDRVSYRKGIFSKEQIAVEMTSIRTVKIDQSFVDRIFNCGTLRIFTAGDLPDIVVGGLPDPDRLRTALRSARGA